MQVIGIKSSLNQKATPLVETNLNRWIMLRRWLPWLAQLFTFTSTNFIASPSRIRFVPRTTEMFQ